MQDTKPAEFIDDNEEVDPAILKLLDEPLETSENVSRPDLPVKVKPPVFKPS